MLLDSAPEDIVVDSATGQIYATDLSKYSRCNFCFWYNWSTTRHTTVIQRIQSMSGIDSSIKPGVISTLNAALSIISSTTLPGSYIQQQASSERV